MSAQKDFFPLVINNLVKTYDKQTAVKNVSFRVRAGEIYGLLGPNGAGKTSLISCVVTLQKPTSGDIQVYGIDPHKDPIGAKKHIGFVPQEIINSGYFDVYEIMQFQSGYFGRRKNNERIDYLLNRLGLWPQRHKKVKALSGGMKRRLLIAKALVHEPKVLLLDEPTAGVDIELRLALWNFVGELKREGISVLLTTHYLEEAEQLCDRVGILREGQLVQEGNTYELVRGLTKRKVILKLKTETPIHHPELIGTDNLGSWEFMVSSQKGVGQLLIELGLPAAALIDVKIEEGDLEDVFRHVLGEVQP
ncbi:MAG: ABC transporter ATP-binding protein [Bdellovibrionaceae bacterium]|nr:ABC transporter ATP-binding protein [Pseudobdellovibrionaceae bacterium]